MGGMLWEGGGLDEDARKDEEAGAGEASWVLRSTGAAVGVSSSLDVGITLALAGPAAERFPATPESLWKMAVAPPDSASLLVLREVRIGSGSSSGASSGTLSKKSSRPYSRGTSPSRLRSTLLNLCTKPSPSASPALVLMPHTSAMRSRRSTTLTKAIRP